MGSKQKQTKLLQREKFERRLAERKTLLLGRGIDQKQQVKDKIIEHLQAEINRIENAIALISNREKMLEKVRLQKLEHAEQRKVKREKAVKKEAELTAPGKEKKEVKAEETKAAASEQETSGE